VRSGWPFPRQQYRLEIPLDARQRLAFGWLILGVVSLLVAGVFSVLLVASRTPAVQAIFPLTDFFHVALVVHVDLSVLVWFAAFAGVFWSINSTGAWLTGGWLALLLCSAGAVVMALAAFVGAPVPVMSNYIPVLDSPLFLSGLLALAGGMGVLVVRSMWAVPRVGLALDGVGALRFALNAAAVSAFVALAAFFWSWLEVPTTLDAKPYYELLFWGGGHVLQFTWTLLMFASWLWLASEADAPIPLTPRVAVFLFGIALFSVFLTPLIYYAWGVASVEHHRMLTWLMRFGGGLSILPIGLAVIVALVRAGPADEQRRVLRYALAMSLILFALGGLIGFSISGSNVKVPAHYHGSIVGVTLAFMGVTYLLLPRLGYREVGARAAKWQVLLYGIGQMMHVTGLVWSGGYGVQRKVAGAEQGLDAIGKIAGMSLMGIGGLIAVIGGVLFLVLVLKSVMRGRTQAEKRSIR
jgi:hypothetical protein